METILLMLNRHQFAVVMAALSAQFLIMPSGCDEEKDLGDTIREIARQVDEQQPTTKEK